MAQAPEQMEAFPEQQQQQQQQQQQPFPGQQNFPQQQQQPFPGQQNYPTGVPAVGMPGTPGGMNMGPPGTIFANGQFVPAGMVPANLGTPGAILPNGQVVANPPVYAPSPGGVMGGGIAAPSSAPVITREQQQFVGVPPGMTRESMQPGYDPRLKRQRRVFDPRFSFKDSFGRSRGGMCRCCTVS